MDQPGPVVSPLPPSVTPERAFLSLPRGRGSFFLDSAAHSGGLGRWSILGFEPYATVAPRDAGSVPGAPGADPAAATGLALGSTPAPRTDAGPPPGALDDLDAILAAHAGHPPRLLRGDIPGPFCGGAVGFFSYDLGRRFERLPAIATDDLGFPDLWFGLYDVFAVFDRASDRGWIVSTGDPESGSAGILRAHRRLEETRAILLDGPRPPGEFHCGTPLSNHTRASYRETVSRCLDWIAAGHVYQVNLSQRFTTSFAGDPAALYLSLRQANPGPFAAFIDLGDRQILSSSPERFLRIEGRGIEARPIKGTRPRGADPAADQRLARELMRSSKDRAELTMIVDLLRNDLGRICEYGSVRVDSLARLESYETVHHLVGVIRGRLGPDVTPCGAVRASFPGGSITGAPKIRAMEIIEELEPVRRGIYCGSIGYFGRDGRTDLNIAIRTALVQRGSLYIHSGGGIVADSDPDAEYDETLHKAEGIFRALEADVNAVQRSTGI